jgi:putative copper export protein
VQVFGWWRTAVVPPESEVAMNHRSMLVPVVVVAAVAAVLAVSAVRAGAAVVLVALACPLVMALTMRGHAAGQGEGRQRHGRSEHR